MTYERKKMLEGIIETPWREMDAFAARVAEIYDDQPEGAADYSATWMAKSMIRAAEEELQADAEAERAAKAAKQAGAT